MTLNKTIMKKQIKLVAVLIFIVTFFSSCEAIEGIFKAGMGVGIFIVLAVVALIIYIMSRFGKK